jgi:hypothetical protein
MVTTGRQELSKLGLIGFPQISMDKTPPSLLLEAFIPLVIHFFPCWNEIALLTTLQDPSSLAFHPNLFPQFPQIQRTIWLFRDHQPLRLAEIYSSEMWVFFFTFPFRYKSTFSIAPLPLPMARLEGPF